MTNDLYHHGVKGMHWGVRRYQNKDGSPKNKSNTELVEYNKRKALEKKYNENSKRHTVESDLSMLSTASNAARSSTGAQKHLLDTLWKEKPNQLDLSNLSDDELRRRINRIDMERRYSNMVNLSPTGKQRAMDAIDIAGDVLAITASAAIIGSQIYKFRHGEECENMNNELYHHGVKGQKWGIRRYQDAR